jgi:hypothetical protein
MVVYLKKKETICQYRKLLTSILVMMTSLQHSRLSISTGNALILSRLRMGNLF